MRQHRWFAVPGYGQVEGQPYDPTREHHILDENAELIAVFETLDDAAEAASAHNAQIEERAR